MFNNATSHSIYAKNALQVANMNKDSGGQQAFLRPGWYTTPDGEVIAQQMCKLHINPTTGQSFQVQKGIQAVLVERRLWPFKGVRLECEKPKCNTCHSFSTCTLCIKGRKCDSCKEAKDHSGHYTKQHICDACDLRKKRCQCFTKKYCTRCKEISL